MEVQSTGPGQQEKIAAGESLTIVSVSSSTTEDVLGCVEDSLRKRAPELTIIPFRKFRNSMFPWFEPSTTPGSDEELAQLMGKSNVRQRVMDFGLRYVVALSGRTQATGIDSWGGCFGGYAGAACVGGNSLDRRTNLTAAILDLKSSRSVGEIEATGSGTSQMGLILLLPYLIVTPTESVTCDALAQRIVRFVTGAPLPPNNAE